MTWSDHARLAFGVPRWELTALILLGLALAGLGYWSYRRQAATPRKRIVLGLLRAAALALVVLLFARPELVVERDLRTPSVVGIWLDNSLSMTLRDPYAADAPMRALVTGQDPRPSRYDLALHALTIAQTGWLKSVIGKQEVAIFTGSTHAEMLTAPTHSSDALAQAVAQLRARTPDGTATDLPAVAADMIQQLQGQPISALVLLTDGQTNTGNRTDAFDKLAQQNATSVFALPLGQESAPLNIALSNVDLPENTFVRDPVSVKFKVQATGVATPTTVHVALYRQENHKPVGSALQAKDIAIDPSKTDYDVEMIFKPTQPERVNLMAVAEPLPNELTTADNSLSATTNVMDAHITALYVDGYPRWEFRYLRNELIREKTVDVSTLLLSADETFAQEGSIPITRFPETADEINKYDVLIIGDVDPQYFSPTQRKLIVDWVAKKGGGLLMIAGQQFSPDAYKGTVLEPLLPIKPDDPVTPTLAAAENTPFRPMMTAAGKASNLFRFFDDPEQNVQQMNTLPELFWYKPVVGLMPSAEVYAVHPLKTSGGIPVPLLVLGRYGKGTTMFSAIADTWRWRYYNGEPLYQSYWLQVLRLLFREKALNENSQLALSTAARSTTLDDAIAVTLKVNDPTLLRAVPLQVPVDVTDAAGDAVETLTLQRSDAGSDTFSGLLPANRLGEFSLRPATGSLPLEVPALAITVRPPDQELATVTADIAGLKQLAHRTDGQVVALPNQEILANLIPDRSIQHANDLSEELWNKPLALVLLVLLLGSEWILRKTAGLM